MLLSSHVTTKSNNNYNNNSSINNNIDMTFSLVDSRLKETAKTHERFPSSMPAPPYTLNNTIDTKLTMLNTTFE